MCEVITKRLWSRILGARCSSLSLTFRSNLSMAEMGSETAQSNAAYILDQQLGYTAAPAELTETAPVDSSLTLSAVHLCSNWICCINVCWHLVCDPTFWSEHWIAPADCFRRHHCECCECIANSKHILYPRSQMSRWVLLNRYQLTGTTVSFLFSRYRLSVLINCVLPLENLLTRVTVGGSDIVKRSARAVTLHEYAARHLKQVLAPFALQCLW